MKKATILKSIEFLLIVILLGSSYLKDLQTVDFHIDESHWIGTSYMFEAFFKGEFWSDAWRESQPTLTNPPIPRYVIGISRFIGGYRIPDLNRRWDYDHNVNFNVRKGAMPSDGLLWWSRLPMAVMAVCSILLGFFFIKKMSGRLSAYLWVFFGATSPFLLLQTRRAMAESSAILFFVMLAAYFCYRAIEVMNQSSRNAPWLVYLYFGLSGFCIGLAGETKINGLSVMLGVVVSLAGFVIWKQKDTIINKARRVFYLSAWASGVTIITFVGTYPYLWPNPLKRTMKILVNRVSEMQYQMVQHAPDAITTLGERLTIVPVRIFQDYAFFHFEGALILNIILVAFGMGLVLLSIRNWSTGPKSGLAAMVLFAIALTATIPIFFTPLDWDRYYLFPVFFSTAFIAIAIGWLGEYSFEWIKTRLAQRIA